MPAQRRVFEAFELQILYDKAERQIEISAAVSEAVASAFENRKALPKGAHGLTSLRPARATASKVQRRIS